MRVHGPLREAQIEVLSADPAGSTGRFYYNATDNQFKIYVGGAWKKVVTGDFDIELSGLPSDGDFLQYNALSQKFEVTTINLGASVPPISAGVTGLFLSNDGTDTGWNDLSGDTVKLNRDGSLEMLGDFDVGNNAVVNVGLVDGVDISQLGLDVTDHTDGTASKHDASEIDYEYGIYTDVNNGTSTVENALRDLDDNKLSAYGKNAATKIVMEPGGSIDSHPSSPGVLKIGDTEATKIEIGQAGVETEIIGDLRVSGTQTTVDTATMDVTDANISVNVGGDQTTANANEAGLTVEMSDATDAQIGYDSSLPAKFKVGEVGSESEVVTTGHAQTINSLKSFSREIQIEQIATPSTPAAGKTKIYATADGLKLLDSTGIPQDVGSGGLEVSEQDSNFTAESNKWYLIRAGVTSISLPAGEAGMIMRISDADNSWATLKPTLVPNGSESIGEFGSGETLVLDRDGAWIQLAWDDAQAKWILDDSSITVVNTTQVIRIPKVTAWESYPPVTQGFGTVGSQLQWRQNGENLEVRGELKTGTTTADEAQIGLIGKTIAYEDAGVRPFIAGMGTRDSTSNSNTLSILATNGDTYFNLSYLADGSSRNPAQPLAGNSVANSGDEITFFASVPVAEFSGDNAYDIFYVAGNVVPLATNTEHGIIKKNKTQKKACSGNVTGAYSAVEISSMTMNNLVIGKRYRFDMHMTAFIANGQRCYIAMKNGSQFVGSAGVFDTQATGSSLSTFGHVSDEFTAIATTLKALIVQGSGCTVRGGTSYETYVRITEIEDSVETTDFT